MLLSFILPTYNVGKYIAEALEPLTQLPQNEIEVIVVIDESPDNSKEIAQSFSGRISNFTILEQKNSGPSAARNHGLSQAKGKYIAFYDPDDKIEIEEFKKLYGILTKTDVDIVVSNGMSFTEDGSQKLLKKDEFRKKLGTVSGPEYFFYAHKHKEYVQYGWINTYKRDFLNRENLRFTPGSSYEDKEFTAKCFSKAKTVIYSKVNCYRYRLRENSLSSANDRFHSPKSVIAYVNVIQNLFDQKRRSQDQAEINVLNHVISECYLTVLRRLPAMKKKGIPEYSQFTWEYINRSKAYDQLALIDRFKIFRKRIKAAFA